MIPLWVPRFSPTLAKAAAEIESNAPGRFRRFTDDNGASLNLHRPEKYSDRWSDSSIKDAFPQRHTTLAPGRDHRDSGGRDVAGVGSVCVPVFRSKFGVDFSPLTSASFAAGILGGMGSGFAVGGPRFFAAVASIRPVPVDPLGTQALWGALLGALNIGASMLVVMSRASR